MDNYHMELGTSPRHTEVLGAPLFLVTILVQMLAFDDQGIGT